ncbi:MAG: RDD family protein [Alphaproteobacteria bacterium ADurb.Bin438]|nr:MAG: RDD family protein [Alphaproteobacteria bacterium ADurb.Bin438]
MEINYKDIYFLLRRFLARLVDSCIIISIFSYAIFHFSKHNELVREVSSFLNPILIIVISLFINIFLESMFIFYFKTTFGKYLLGISIVDEKGNGLGLLKSFKRAWLVYFKGLAMGVLFVTIISVAFLIIYYKENKNTEWDKTLETKVVFHKFDMINNFVILAFLCLISIFAFKNYKILNKSIFYLQHSINYQKNLVVYKTKSLKYLEENLIVDGKMVDLDESLMKSKQIFYDTKVISIITNNMFSNNFFISNDDIKKSKEAELKIKSFIGFMECSIESKIDIIQYLKKYQKDYEITDGKIDFKDLGDRYFFDLRLNHLNECKKLI